MSREGCDDNGLVRKYLKTKMADEEQILINAGVCNPDGTLTYQGKELVFTVLLEENKPALVEAAKAILADKEE